MPNEGVQDVANTDVAGVLSTMDCPTCSIQIMYPRAEGPYVGKDAITKYLQTAPKATINVLGAPSASHEESDGSVVVTWKMQLEGGMAVGLAVQAMGIPWKTPINMKAVFKFDGDNDKISSITVDADSSQQPSLLALGAESMRRDNSQVGVAASALASTTNEAKLAAVDAYIKARMPNEGVQDVANTDVAGVLSTMDCPTCSIQIMYPRAEGPYVGKDAITKYLQTAPKATINVLGAPSASHEESDGSVVVTWKMQLEGGMAVGLAVQAMGIPWKTPINMKAVFKFDGDNDKISSITVEAA